ncbi:hypothetical protein GCM10007160_31770 [Litchfieldella qijiaojingensis]|uniref:Lipoprotein n=1 Tax=Litchfieldella qijiaojingensis TaxID=980347 RepID=A0ABQ2Z4H7_9GAMM|nr:hypothetical protein [Halomonas qijiaojingensis]GGY01512.1 hypothetical protein GCM10007160_31770 [Halomonas qijiaojingensis]
MNKPLITLTIVLLSALLVAGCSYQPARIKSEPLIVIDDDRRHHDGSFCPPGQAKKGNC